MTTQRQEIWLKIGQSNAVGSDGSEDVFINGVDSEHPKIFEFSRGIDRNGYTSPAYGELMPARVQTQDNDNPGNGFAMPFAKTRLLRNTSIAKIILINAAKGATSFTAGNWVAGDQYALNARNYLVLALQNNPNAIFAGILWHQGENDQGQTQEWYQDQLLALVTYLRDEAEAAAPGRVEGVFLCGTMLEAYIAADEGARRPIDAAHRNVKNYIDKSTVVDFIDLTDARDYVHFSAPSLRIMGDRYGVAADSLIYIKPERSSPSSMLMTDTVALKRNSGSPSVDKYGDRIYAPGYLSVKCRISHERTMDSLGVEGNQSRMSSNERTTKVRLYTKTKIEIGDVILLYTDVLNDESQPFDTDGFQVHNVVYMKSPNTCLSYYMAELS